jgi:hypothetical protein
MLEVAPPLPPELLAVDEVLVLLPAEQAPEATKAMARVRPNRRVREVSIRSA